MKPKTLSKAATAENMLIEMRKLVSDATAGELFKVAVAASAAGWVLAAVDTFGAGVRIYGGLMFLAGLITSLVMFERD